MLKYVFLIFTSYIGKSIFILWISFIWWCNEYKHINLFGQFLTLSLQGCHRGSLSMEGLPKWAMSGSLNITSITGDVMIYYVETTWYISYISVRAYPIPLWLYFLKNPTQKKKKKKIHKESPNNFPKHPPKTAPSIFHRFFFHRVFVTSPVVLHVQPMISAVFCDHHPWIHKSPPQIP